jgi:hypothetical protein
MAHNSFVRIMSALSGGVTLAKPYAGDFAGSSPEKR